MFFSEDNIHQDLPGLTFLKNISHLGMIGSWPWPTTKRSEALIIHINVDDRTAAGTRSLENKT